ncbi:MAG: hypothetical protein ACOCYU_02835 [Brevefilum sp.]
MYDLTLIPIHTQQGRPLQHISGFKAAGPPRRAARSRSEDMLILSLIIQGNNSISPEMQTAWLERLSQVFFKTSGSVTSALRSLIETLNLTMMEKNLKLARDGGWSKGMINLAAVHRRSLYIAQSGQTHAFTLTHAGLQHFQDSSQSDRGLGLSRTPSIRFFQADLGTGGYLFMTDSPPETWREDLILSDGFPSQERLRRRLLNQAPVDFRLDLVQIRAGEGQIQTLAPTPRPEKQAFEQEPAPAAEESAPETFPESMPEPLEAEEILEDTQKVPVADDVDQQEEIVSESEAEETGPERSWEDGKATPVDSPAPPVSATEDSEEIPDVQRESKPSSRTIDLSGEQEPSQTASQSKPISEQVREEGLRGLASFFDWWHATWNKVGNFFKDLFARFMPDREVQVAQLSRSTMIWVAVLVPVLVVAIAVSVYLSRGRRLQYDHYLNQAQAAQEAALAADDPVVERGAWYEVLNALDQAEDIRNTEEVSSMRLGAQDALDILDGALRIAYQPALRDMLSTDINIAEIVSYGRDLYLHDDASGWIIHAMRENDIYEVDTEFLCAPGNYSGGALGAIVDMVSLPINNAYQAHLLAIDEFGNVAYCSPGQDPVVQSLPDMSGESGAILRIAYENNTLYVLNPSMNAIQVYSVTNGQFLDPPDNYFEGAAEAEVPDLTSVVDLDVNGSELYLLHGDGSLVNCVYSGLPDNPVTCQDPVQYLDGRPGLEDQSLSLPDGQFTSVFYTPPPTPLVNIVDATHAEVYRFSLRFKLYQRLRPDMGDHEVANFTATAFTIGEIEQLAFIAFGNQVFFAYVD